MTYAVIQLNDTQYPASFLEPEERDFWGEHELAPEPPLSEDALFALIEGRVFVVAWPDDDFPW